MMQLTHPINEQFENNCFTLVIFINLPKAFDTVNLISKLKKYRVKGKNLSLFKSYLENRKEYLNYSNNVN